MSLLLVVVLLRDFLGESETELFTLGHDDTSHRSWTAIENSNTTSATQCNVPKHLAGKKKINMIYKWMLWAFNLNFDL